MPSFSTTLEQAIHGALALANARRHELATLEHLLLALIDEPDAAKVMQACRVDLDVLRTHAVEFIDDDLSTLVTDVEGSEAVPTAAFQRVIQRAAIHVQTSGRTEVTGANVLVAIFAERESNAAYFLQEQDMTRYDAVNFIAHGVAKDPSFGESRPVSGATEQEETPKAEAGEAKESALSKYCVDLNAKARKGDVDPLIGRELEVERCIQVLCRRRKNNPLLVGDPGVGKTAIAEGLAWKIVKRETPEVLSQRHDLLARHGRAAGRHPLPRRFRGAAEGGGQGAGGPSRRHSLHRRDPHGDRRRRHLGRGDGRLEPAETRAAGRQAALHGLAPPTRSSASTSRRTARSAAGSRRSTSTSPRSRTR